MICNNYTSCGCCINDSNCPLDHYGDGSPFCGKFQCNVEECNSECISHEDLLEVYE